MAINFTGDPFYRERQCSMKGCFVFLAIVVLVLSACAAPGSAAAKPPIEVRDAWVRAAAAGGGMAAMSDTSSNSALYLVIKNNGKVSDTLVKAESDAAGMVQIHLGQVDANGVASMHQVEGIEIPAGGTVELKPGSYHIMLMGLKRGLNEGETVSFTLTFKHAGALAVTATVKAP
jgi:copper(I)-binding protein